MNYPVLPTPTTEEMAVCVLCLREKLTDDLVLVEEKIDHEGQWRGTYVCGSCEQRTREVAVEAAEEEPHLLIHQEPCRMPECRSHAFFECFMCGHLFCGAHTIRLPQWCQFHQDCCVKCYEELPEERKQGAEVAQP